MSAKREQQDSIWWGEFELPEGRTARWRVGPLEVAAQRRKKEWKLAATWQSEGEPEDLPIGVDLEAAPLDLTVPYERFVFAATTPRLLVLPALADRSVVTRPRAPFHLPAGEETVLYVGSPLWVRVETGEPPTRLLEVPVRRPSDTWFGPSTREGELCYATRTRAVLKPENLPLLAGRAITPVRLRNASPQDLPLDRLKLPVRHLSVFSSGDGRLWTERVTMERTDPTENATMDVDEGAPQEVAGGKRVTPPRDRPEKGTLVRAFSSLLGTLA